MAGLGKRGLSPIIPRSRARPVHRFGECHSRGSLTTSAREMVRGTHPTLAEVANSVLCDAKENARGILHPPDRHLSFKHICSCPIFDK